MAVKDGNAVKIAPKKCVMSKLLISKLRNGASATLKQQGPEGRKSIKIATKNSRMLKTAWQ